MCVCAGVLGVASGHVEMGGAGDGGGSARTPCSAFPTRSCSAFPTRWRLENEQARGERDLLVLQRRLYWNVLLAVSHTAESVHLYYTNTTRCAQCKFGVSCKVQLLGAVTRAHSSCPRKGCHRTHRHCAPPRPHRHTGTENLLSAVT